MSKLHGYDRSKLLGKVHQYGLQDFHNYALKRCQFIIRESFATSNDDYDITSPRIDVPIFNRHVHEWLTAQHDTLILSSSGDDQSILTGIECALMSIQQRRHDGKKIPNADLSHLRRIIARVKDNIKRRKYDEKTTKLHAVYNTKIQAIRDLKQRFSIHDEEYKTAAALERSVERLYRAACAYVAPPALPGTWITKFDWWIATNVTQEAIHAMTVTFK
jgi:hypothetical protein